MSRPFLIFSQSDYVIRIVAINSHTQWQIVQIQISWLLQNFRSQLIRIHTVCKGMVHPGSAGQGLRGLDMLVRFSVILYKGDNLFALLFNYSTHQVPSEKGSSNKFGNTQNIWPKHQKYKCRYSGNTTITKHSPPVAPKEGEMSNK